jgi:hypothetical protein
VGFVVDKVTLRQVFSEYFGVPCQSSFHQLLHNHPNLSSGAGTIGQKGPQYKGLGPNPLALKKSSNNINYKGIQRIMFVLPVTGIAVITMFALESVMFL